MLTLATTMVTVGSSQRVAELIEFSFAELTEPPSELVHRVLGSVDLNIVRGNPFAPDRPFDCSREPTVGHAMPDSFCPTLRRGGRGPARAGHRAFGADMASSYDLFLYSNSQAMDGTYTDVELVLPGSQVIKYTRTSSGTGYSNAVFQTTQTPSEFYGSTIAWVGGWDLTMKDGTVLHFGDSAPLQSITDRFGNRISITRNGAGNITEISSTSGRWVSFTYNGDSPPHVSQIQDNSGRVVKYAYTTATANGQVLTQLHTATTFADPVNRPNGETTTYNWQDPNTPTGITSIVDPRNITFITDKYDSSGRVQTQTLANGGVFNSDHYPVSDIRGLGSQEQQTTTYTHQPTSDLVTDVVDQLGRDTHYDYNQMANVKAVTLLYGTPNASTTSFSYEPIYNRPTSVQAPMSRTTTFAWDDDARSVTITDPRGVVQTVFLNRAGDPKLVQDGLGNQTQFGYDLGDLTSMIDALGRTTSIFVDSAGREAAVTDPLGHRTIWSYDNLDRVTKVTDPLGGVTSLSYGTVLSGIAWERVTYFALFLVHGSVATGLFIRWRRSKRTGL